MIAAWAAGFLLASAAAQNSTEPSLRIAIAPCGDIGLDRAETRVLLRQVVGKLKRLPAEVIELSQKEGCGLEGEALVTMFAETGATSLLTYEIFRAGTNLDMSVVLSLDVDVQETFEVSRDLNSVLEGGELLPVELTVALGVPVAAPPCHEAPPTGSMPKEKGGSRLPTWLLATGTVLTAGGFGLLLLTAPLTVIQLAILEIASSPGDAKAAAFALAPAAMLASAAAVLIATAGVSLIATGLVLPSE